MFSCHTPPQSNRDTALRVLEQTQAASVVVWSIVPDEAQQAEQAARCERWEGSGACPTLLALVGQSIDEARRLLSTAVANVASVVTEVMRYIADLINLLKDHGVPIPAWVAFAFQTLALIFPLLL